MIALEDRIKVVIDTNVFISAFAFDRKPLEVIKLFINGDIEVYISPFIINEITKILKEKFDWEETRISKVLSIIEDKAITIYPLEKISVIEDKDDDNRILECALEGKVDYIITGDKKHLLSLKEFKRIKIVSVDEFLGILGI